MARLEIQAVISAAQLFKMDVELQKERRYRYRA